MVDGRRASFLPIGGGTDPIERSPKLHAGSSDSHKLDGKNQQEVIHWHARYIPASGFSRRIWEICEGSETQ